MNLLPLTGNAKVAVIGSGVSGLSFAYFLHKFRPDVNITIYEKSNRSGGWINSQVVKVGDESILLEKGPRTLRGVSNGTVLIVDTLEQLGKWDQIEVLPKKSIANKKWLWSESGLIPVPSPFTWSSLFQFLTHSNIIKPQLFAGVLKEPFVKQVKNDESIETFFRRRFGNTILTDNVLSAILHGIYAGDVATLSVKSVLPSIKRLEQDYGSITKAILTKLGLQFKILRTRMPKTNILPEIYDNYKQISSTDLLQLSTKLKQYPMIKLQAGLQVFTDSITEYLSHQDKITIKYSANITQIDIKTGIINLDSDGQEQYDHIRSTINVNQLSKLITNSDPQVKTIFENLEYVSVFLVNIYSKKPNLIPTNKNGFGFLVPKFGGKNTNHDGLLGIIYDSDVEKQVTKFDGEPIKNMATNGGYDKITLMMGGWYYNNESPTKSFQIQCIKKVLSKYLQIDPDIELIIRDEEAITNKNIDDIKDGILVSFNYHKQCIPQYQVGYESNKQDILGLLCDSKLSLGGQAFGKGIGVPDCVENAFEAASKLSRAQVEMREVLITEEEARQESDKIKQEIEQIERQNQAQIEDEKSRYY